MSSSSPLLSISPKWPCPLFVVHSRLSVPLSIGQLASQSVALCVNSVVTVHEIVYRAPFPCFVLHPPLLSRPLLDQKKVQGNFVVYFFF